MEEGELGKNEAQPDWVPDWVWGSYCNGSYTLNGAKQVVAAKGCAGVWASLERRIEKPSRPHAARLFMAVHRALDFSGAASMGTSERKRRAAAIRNAVKVLNSEIEAAQLPMTEARAFAWKASSAEAIEEAGFLGSIFLGVVGSGIEARSFETGARISAEFLATLHLPKLLEAVARDADNWAKDATVFRPNKPNAARTYFLREMTDFFSAAYGEPLRATTLALAYLFFECESMTTADIARLAPVRKRD